MIETTRSFDTFKFNDAFEWKVSKLRVLEIAMSKYRELMFWLKSFGNAMFQYFYTKYKG